MPPPDQVSIPRKTAPILSRSNWSKAEPAAPPIGRKPRQKLLSNGKDWELSRRLLLSYNLVIEPVHASDAEQAARHWRRGNGLSLADRLCLATAERLDAVVWTADTAWGAEGRIRQIR